MDLADLLIPAEQEQKMKSFMSLSFPSVPARNAAGGHTEPRRWGPLLIAGVVAMSSIVLLIGRPRSG